VPPPADWFRRSALLVVCLAACWWASRFALDFSIYRHASEATLFGGLNPYGGVSGLGWPMWYRYPPFFLLPFSVFAFLPLGVGAFVWALGKCAVALVLIRELAGRLDVSWGVGRWLPAACVVAPYWMLELRYGNAQFYMFGLTAFALLWAASRPRWAGTALGAAIAIKVWPAFFAPLLWMRGGRRAAGATLVAGAALTLAPAAVFGWSTNAIWLADWYAQESEISADAGVMWFPSQSLYGVARRYFSVIDYSTMPDTNYQTIHLAELSPETIRLMWLAVAAVSCTWFFAGAWRAAGRRELAWAALGFCVLALFQPFAQRHIALTVLLWPAIVAAARAEGWARWPLYLAGCISVGQLLFSADGQRLLLVMGSDAAVVALLALSLLPHVSAPDRRVTH